MPAYQYEPLSSPDSIRLLLLQPSDARDAELKGSLLNTTLAECDYDLIDSYTALSYVWGSSEKPCQILLDDMAFAITRSLNDALSDMRDATRLRRIWADAVCINQEDIPERNSQVLIMKDVYSTAHSTVIHLGGLTKELDAIFEAGPPVLQYDVYGTYYYEVARKDVELARADILARPWFTRVWVLQELVYSKDPWVQCSTKRMRWSDLQRLFFGPDIDHRGMDSVMQRMNSFRQEPLRSGPFRHVLESRRGCGAQDPRDLVYANISISEDKEIANCLKIDYNDSLLQVFTKAALYISSYIHPSSLMDQVDDVPAEKRVPGLPSWAPDWRLPPSSRCHLDSAFRFWDRSITSRDYGSSYALFTETFHAFTDRNLPPVLGHIGFKIGVIESISGILPEKGSQQNPSPVAKDFQQIYKKLAEMSRSIDICTKAFEQRQKHWEVEHEKCCDILSDSWSRWFQNLHETPQLGGLGSKDFISYFCQWVSKQTTKIRIEDGGLDTKDWSGMFKCLQFYCNQDQGEWFENHLFQRHFPEEVFEGRRLAFTQDGRCGLVPSRARKGDMVGFLAQGDLPAIFRPKRTDRNSEIGEAIVRALRRGKLGRIDIVKRLPREEQETRVTIPLPELESFSASLLWEFPTEGAVDVEHYSIIGECFFEDWYSLEESRLPKIENLRVFALH